MLDLKKLIALEREADLFGFKWDNAEQILTQIKSECAEISEHLNDGDHPSVKLQEEMGDLMHAVYSLCLFCKLDPSATLERSVEKFERRFVAVKRLADEQGLDSLQGQPFAKLMMLWDQAKQKTG